MSPIVKWSAILIALAALVIGLTCLLPPRHEDPNQYTLRLKWLHQAQFAGFYRAQEDKLYENAGIKIKIEQGGPDFPAIKTVLAGRENFGVTGADQVLLARSNGAPIVPLLVVYRESPFVLFAPTKTGITKPEDFVGKRIGVKRGGNEELIYRALLAKRGVKVSSGSEIPVQFDLSPLLAGAVDVWPGYAINEPLVAAAKGLPVILIKPSDYGVKLYADTVFTTEQMIRDHPETVRAFIAATLEGWTRAVANPDEAGRLSLQFASQSDLAHQQAMMKASLPFINPDQRGIGVMTMAGWEQTSRLLIDGGFLKNQVDLAALLEQARLAGAPVQ